MLYETEADKFQSVESILSCMFCSIGPLIICDPRTGSQFKQSLDDVKFPTFGGKQQLMLSCKPKDFNQ